MSSRIDWHESYRHSRSDLLARTSEMGSAPLHRYTTLVTDVTELVVLSDENFRLSERCEVFDAQAERGRDALARAREYNDLALGVLREDLPAAIEAMREELSGLGEGDTLAPAFAAAEETVGDAVIELDLTARQAREARGIITAKFEAGRQGPRPLCDSALEDVRQLVELRERREVHNDPVGAAAAALFTVALIVYVRAVGAPGGPGWNFFTIAIAFLIVAMIGGAIFKALGPLIPKPA